MNPQPEIMTELMTELDRRAARKGVGVVLYYVAVTIFVAVAARYFRSGMCGPGLDLIALMLTCVASLILWGRSAVLMFAKDSIYKYSFAVHTLVCGGFLLVTLLAMGS
jgi:hypothetical protein